MKLDAWEKLSDKEHGKPKDNKMLCVANGLRLLEQKLCELNADSYSVCAEHDELFASGPPPSDITWFDTELEMLAAWGWRWDEDLDSWAIFT
jgi:hypothetical protein